MANDDTLYATTIMSRPDEVYAFWRDFKNLPRISRHIKSIEVLDDKRSRWTAEGPSGEVTWEAIVTEDQPGRRIAWQSVEEADVKNSGEIDFKPAPGGRGTEVYVKMQYDAPGGFLGAWWAKITGNDPEQATAETLRRLKALLECGELPVVEGQPSEKMRSTSMPGDEPRKVGLR